MGALRQVGLYLFTVFACLSVTLPEAFAQDFYVKADATGRNDGDSWEDAFTDLEAALDVAFPGEEIWVAAGTYRPSAELVPGNPRTATFQLRNDVALYGGFAGTETEWDQRDPALNDRLRTRRSSRATWQGMTLPTSLVTMRTPTLWRSPA